MRLCFVSCQCLVHLCYNPGHSKASKHLNSQAVIEGKVDENVFGEKEKQPKTTSLDTKFT